MGEQRKEHGDPVVSGLYKGVESRIELDLIGGPGERMNVPDAGLEVYMSYVAALKLCLAVSMSCARSLLSEIFSGHTCVITCLRVNARTGKDV